MNKTKSALFLSLLFLLSIVAGVSSVEARQSYEEKYDVSKLDNADQEKYSMRYCVSATGMNSNPIDCVTFYENGQIDINNVSRWLVSFNADHRESKRATEERKATDARLQAEQEAMTPEDLTASKITKNSVKLSWDAVEDATEYNVYKDNVLTTTTTKTSVTMTGLKKATSYIFSVTSKFISDEFGSQESDKASVSVKTK